MNKGFTLVEVMIAMIVLGIGLLGVAAMQVYAIKTNHMAQARFSGNQVALSFMEEMKRMDYDDIMLSDENGLNFGGVGLNDGRALTAGIFPDLTVTTVDHGVSDIGFINGFPNLAGTYRVSGAGANARLVDESNNSFMVFYNILASKFYILSELMGGGPDVENSNNILTALSEHALNVSSQIRIEAILVLLIIIVFILWLKMF